MCIFAVNTDSLTQHLGTQPIFLGVARLFFASKLWSLLQQTIAV